MDFKDKNLSVQVYESMELGTKKEDISAAREWLEKHKYLDCWIDGKYFLPEDEITYLEILLGKEKCLVAEGFYGVQTAMASSIEAHHQWTELDMLHRLTILNEITKELQSKKRLFTNFYDLQCQKNDFDLFLDCFNFYSSMTINDTRYWKATGVVLIILSDATPVWFLAMASAAALWAGCSIILNPSTKAPVFPFILAEICSGVGLPKGLINVVPGSNKVTNSLSTLKFDKIIFSGKYCEGLHISYMVPVNNFSLFIFGHTAFIIFESGDMDSAIDKLFSENWKFSKPGTWSADLIVVQESIFKTFIEKLTSKMRNLDMSDCEIKYKNSTTIYNLQKILQEAKKVGVKIYEPEDFSGTDQILISEYDLNISEPDAPITTLLAFKTAKDATDIVNRHSYSVGASIWTENLNQAIELSSLLDTCTIWINCHGVMDASVPIEVMRKSGTGVLGGLDGGLALMTDNMGGKNKAELTNLCNTFSKDLEEIIKKSHDSFKKWQFNKNRKEHLMNITDKIQLAMESESREDILSRTVRFWAFNGNSYDITMCATKDNLYAAQSKKPIGVIAMILNDNQENIKTFVSWVTPAIAMGNVVIVVVSEIIYPRLEPIIKCFLENLPNGVVNIVKGITNAQQLANDSCVKAVWTKNVDSPVWNNISSFKRSWSPPNPIPLCKMLLAKHCLKSHAIWFPAINSSG